MKIFDFNVPLVNITGETHATETLGSTLAMVIGQQTSGKTLKLYEWMQLLRNAQALHLDESDRLDLLQLIEQDSKLYLFAKGQLIVLLSQ